MSDKATTLEQKSEMPVLPSRVGRPERRVWLFALVIATLLLLSFAVQLPTYHAADWSHFAEGDPDGAGRKLMPLVDRMEFWETDGQILPGLDVQGAPGHTPGSTIMVVSNGGERAMLLGDVVHCPIELVEDDWQAVFDVDPELAQRTRTAVARELEGSDVPIAAAHFPGLQFGRLLEVQGRRSWRY